MLYVAQQYLNCDVPPFGPGGLQSVAEVALPGQCERSVVEVVVVGTGIDLPMVSVHDVGVDEFDVMRLPFGSSMLGFPLVVPYITPLRSTKGPYVPGIVPDPNSRYPVASTERY